MLGVVASVCTQPKTYLVMKETTMTVQIDVCMHERISFKIFEQETQGRLFANLRAAARLRKFSPNS